MIKNEVIHSNSITPIAKLLVTKNKNQFRLLDDLDSDNCNDYQMHGEKVTLCDDKLRFSDSGVVFTLKGDILSMITDYDFNETDSPDAKEIIKFLDKLHFDIHAKSNNSGNENLLKNFYNKITLLASGLHELIFLSETPNELCEGLRLIIQEKQTANDAKKFISKLLLYLIRYWNTNALLLLNTKIYLENLIFFYYIIFEIT